MRVVWVRLAAAVTLGLLAVIAVADDLNGPVSFVPWKVLIPGDTPASVPLTARRLRSISKNRFCACT